MDSCLDDNTVLELVCGTLDVGLQGRAQEHLDRCDACRELVASAVPDGEGAVDDWGHLQIGAKIDRYQVTDILGAGAMGFVFAATDLELGRTVALKLLRTSGAAAEALRPRLLREAQALARLSHPNVVAVHDVGTFNEHLFVALEWIDGGTLATWLEEPRSAREIVGAFRQAGEGIAAAHAAALVHRDIKPDNVLVGKDGRVRVTDFGLALAIEDVAGDEPMTGEVAELRLTATGALVGTPAYVSPEQLDGEPADVRSDQFSFCVALFEALHGYKPFAGDDWPTLRAAVRAGVVVRQSGRRVPRWLDRIVARGLRREPAERWPSMRALLDALARGPLVTPLRVGMVAVAAGAIAVAMIAKVRPDPCDDAAWTVWSDADATALQARLASHPGVAATVDRAFRNYGAAWSRMTVASCRATKVDGSQTREAFEVRERCLAERHDYAQQLAIALFDGPPPRPDGALEVASGLPSIDECANTHALLAIVPEAASERRASLQARMARATIDGYLRADQDPKRFQALADEARALGMPTLEARALLMRARRETDEVAEEAALQRSALAAFAARDDAALADAWQRLVFHTGFHVARYQDSAQWATYAKAAIDRLGGDPVREAELSLSRGWGLMYEGRTAEADAAMAHARELFVQARGPDDARVAAAINGQGAVKLAAGKFAEALDLYQQSRELGKQLGGTSSQPYVTATDNAANALIDLGRVDEGLAMFEANDRTSETSSWRQLQIAAALRLLHRFDDALAHDQHAQELATTEKQSGPRSLDPVFGIALDLVGLGRSAEAAPLFDQVMAARAHSAADDLAAVEFELAKALRDRDPARARALAQQARERIAPLGAVHADDLRDIDDFLAKPW